MHSRNPHLHTSYLAAGLAHLWGYDIVAEAMRPVDLASDLEYDSDAETMPTYFWKPMTD